MLQLLPSPPQFCRCHCCHRLLLLLLLLLLLCQIKLLLQLHCHLLQLLPRRLQYSSSILALLLQLHYK
jgi:hypothetical protein